MPHRCKKCEREFRKSRALIQHDQAVHIDRPKPRRASFDIETRYPDTVWEMVGPGVTEYYRRGGAVPSISEFGIVPDTVWAMAGSLMQGFNTVCTTPLLDPPTIEITAGPITSEPAP